MHISDAHFKGWNPFLCTLLCQMAWAEAARIAVLHLYPESESRIIPEIIDNELARAGFKVVNPFAHTMTEEKTVLRRP